MATLVGRAAELARLANLLDEAAAGHAVAALVSGDAGVGKSRLVAEVAARAASRRGMAPADHARASIGERAAATFGRRRDAIAHVRESRHAQIGLVDAVLANSIVEIHARKRCFDLMPRRFKCRGQEAFDYFPNALRLRIAHLQIDLGEFWLAVGSEVFVAEAAHDLEIFIEARDH